MTGSSKPDYRQAAAFRGSTDLPQPNDAEIGVKERADTPGLEVKGLVAMRRDPALAAIASHLEIWCKWSCTIPGLKIDGRDDNNENKMASEI